jgi:hypothetical protein
MYRLIVTNLLADSTLIILSCMLVRWFQGGFKVVQGGFFYRSWWFLQNEVPLELQQGVRWKVTSGCSARCKSEMQELGYFPIGMR